MTEYAVTNQDGTVTNVPAEENAGLGDSAAANDTVAAATTTPEGDEVVANSQPAYFGAEHDAAAVDIRAKNEEDSKDAAAEQRTADTKFRAENPDKPLVRGANPEVGGESF